MRLANLAILGTTLLLSTPVLAGPKAGNSEVGLALNYTNVEFGNTDSATTTIYGSYGYHVTDAWQIRAALIGSFADGGDNGTYQLGADYHFNTAADTVPYLGASYAADFNESEGLYDLHAGIKQFLSEKFTIDYRLSVQQAIDSDIDLTFTTASIGFSYYF